MEIKDLYYKNLIRDINYTFTHTKIYGIFTQYESQATLLFELISGLIKPTRGLINLKGKKVYMLFKDSDSQVFNATVKDEILYGLKENEVNLEEICDSLDINEAMLKKDPSKLTKSEKKLVVMASMLAYNPDIILIDNFLNSLDYSTKKKIISILKRLQFDYHKQLIIADQNVDLLYELVDIAIILEDEILVSGNKYDVFRKSDILESLGIEIPSYIKFSDLVLTSKNVDLGYRDRVTDIMKDVYDNV